VELQAVQAQVVLQEAQGHQEVVAVQELQEVVEFLI
jgi:hypothetical protein